MFGSALPVDEFRALLKEHVAYDDSNGEWNADKLQEIVRLAKVKPAVVENWVSGMQRPTPGEERTLIALLKGLKNFAL